MAHAGLVLTDKELTLLETAPQALELGRAGLRAAPADAEWGSAAEDEFFGGWPLAKRAEEAQPAASGCTPWCTPGAGRAARPCAWPAESEQGMGSFWAGARAVRGVCWRYRREGP